MHKKVSIRFNHTSVQSKQYKSKILKRFSRVVESGIFLNGPEVTLLEQKLSSYFGKYTLSCASGHDALLLALNSLKLSPEDEVIYPVNSYPTAFPVHLAGVKGVPVDVDENGQIDPVDLGKRITKKTKAVIIVHLYGLVGRLSELILLLRKKKIFIIEDCAQAFGTIYKGKLVGTFGDIGCFSFYPTKNIGTLGDGGAICTKHSQIYKYLLSARAYGAKVRYNSDFISGHSRIPELQAGVLNIYLENSKKEFDKRKELYKIYEKKFAKVYLGNNISFFNSNPQSDPVIHLLTIKVKNRNKLMKHLSQLGIESHIHYPHPVHTVAAFSFLKLKKGAFPVAEKLSEQIVSLPFHQYLKNSEIEYIVDAIRSYYEKNNS